MDTMISGAVDTTATPQQLSTPAPIAAASSFAHASPKHSSSSEVSVDPEQSLLGILKDTGTRAVPALPPMKKSTEQLLMDQMVGDASDASDENAQTSAPSMK